MEASPISPSPSTECLSAFIDTTISDCVAWDGSLVSLGDFSYSEAKSEGLLLDNFGLTGMDNGSIFFDKDTISDDYFEYLLHSKHKIEENDKRLRLQPVKGNNKRFSYGNEITELNGTTCAKLTGGFFQGFFRAGNGCEYSILPSKIGNGVSLEFELYRKELETEGETLNDAYGNAKGTFFYIGTRAENKFVRYYGDECDEESEKEKTELETFGGVPLGEHIEKLSESDNKYLSYNRSCSGKTVYDTCEEPQDYRNAYENGISKVSEENGDVYITDDYFEGDNKWECDENVAVETSAKKYSKNLFTVFSRSCEGETVYTFDEDSYKVEPKYNVFKDLWNNALSFFVSDDNRVGYRYLVKDCDSENPRCSYKIESETSKEGNVPYSEWTTIHVRILPFGKEKMRLLFYVDGRLVLYSKELPKLDLRELSDLPEKQEGVPFNISVGGGTQGLADVVYEDFRTYHLLDYPLQREFGGSFVGYMKSFRFYECSLNHTLINNSIRAISKPFSECKIYSGVISFNTKPSLTTIEEQAPLFETLNEYPDDTKQINLRIIPDNGGKYVRFVVAVPLSSRIRLLNSTTTINGIPEINKVSIISMYNEIEPIFIGNEQYIVWYCTYATKTMINNIVTIELGNG